MNDALQSAQSRIPLTSLFANATHTLPRIAPDASAVAYLADAQSVYNVWLRDLRTGEERQLTFATATIKDFHWLPDGSGFIYAIDNDGDENDELFRFDLTTTETEAVCAYPGVKARIHSVDYHHPEAILITSNRRNVTLFDVYRYDIAKRTLDLVAPNPGDVVDWYADRKLIVRVAKSLTDSGGVLLSLLNDGEFTDLVEGTHEDTLEPIEFMADGDLLMLSSVHAATARLVKLNVFANDSEVLYEHHSLDIVDLCTALNGTHVEFVATQLECTAWHSLDQDAALHVAALNRQMPGDWSVVSRDVADREWVVRCESDDTPVTYYLYHAARYSSNVLFSEQAQLLRYELAQMQPIAFETRDGLTLHGFYTAAQSRDEERVAPLMIVVHDGPWSRDHWGWNPEVQWLADRGYSVLQVNFRGSSGFGKTLLAAGDREWGGKMHDDILDAKAWAVEQGFAEPDRCGIYGFSYGGYEVLTALSMTPGAFACGIALCAPANLITLIETIPPYWKPTRSLLKARIGDIISERAMLAARSPVNRMHEVTAPLLLVHGANDPRVNLAETEQMVERMQTQGQAVELMIFRDEGHGLSKPENRLQFFERAELFLAQCFATKMIHAGRETGRHGLR